MSFILPYDIIVKIIDTVGEDKDILRLKELALVSHSFHQICCKHLFATVGIHNPCPKRPGVFSKKSFVWNICDVKFFSESSVRIYSRNTILFIYLLCLQYRLRAKVRTASTVSLSQFDKSIFCAMGKCSEITAHVLRRNCWVNSVHCIKVESDRLQYMRLKMQFRVYV